MDHAVREYIEAIKPDHRALFDRLHRLILDAHPAAVVSISYKIPTYSVGKHRLFVGAWQHGISVYGWGADRDSGFSARHPELLSGRATLQLTPAAAAAIPDDELAAFVRAALAP